MYKIKILKVRNESIAVMWIVSDLFLKDIPFTDSEWSPSAGDDSGWSSLISWYVYL